MCVVLKYFKHLFVLCMYLFLFLFKLFNGNFLLFLSFSLSIFILFLFFCFFVLFFIDIICSAFSGFFFVMFCFAFRVLLTLRRLSFKECVFIKDNNPCQNIFQCFSTSLFCHKQNQYLVKQTLQYDTSCVTSCQTTSD